ncbi:MAG: hypothetical protein OQJ89_12745, partial [Kangiellaceae bacterium]|nr:hypothetical protein [Kangiellaceae bacterium]
KDLIDEGLTARRRTKQKIMSNPRLIAVTLITAASSLISSSSHGHEFLSEILTNQTMSGTVTFVPVANYQLNKEQIVAKLQVHPHVDYYQQRTGQLVAVQRNPDKDCESSGSKTCGQFDHFSMARSAAIITCHQLAQQEAELYPSGLIPLYLAPSTFVEAGSATDDHHINYNLDQGINFNCGYMPITLDSDQDS